MYIHVLINYKRTLKIVWLHLCIARDISCVQWVKQLYTYTYFSIYTRKGRKETIQVSYRFSVRSWELWKIMRNLFFHSLLFTLHTEHGLVPDIHIFIEKKIPHLSKCIIIYRLTSIFEPMNFSLNWTKMYCFERIIVESILGNDFFDKWM